MDPLKLTFRAAGYAVLSLLALFVHPAGLAKAQFPYIPVLLIAFGISLGFFSAYSAIFHPRPRVYPMPPEDLAFERKAFVFFTLLGLALAGGCLAHLGTYPEHLPAALAIALAAYAFPTLLYGFFLLWRYPRKTNPPIRFQLIFPILISITLPLYVGLNISGFSSNYSLVPLGIFWIYYLVAVAWAKSRRRLALWSLITLICSGVLARLFPPLRPHIASFLFAGSVSAYAAVFEAWNVTNRAAFLAKSWNAVARQYYLATFAALVCSIFAAAILYVFTSMSVILLMLFAIHSVISLFVWYAAAPDSRLLIDGR